MISFSEALRIVLEEIREPRPTETTPLVLSAGRILAEDIVAPINLPEDPNSAMDGYAVRAADLEGAAESSPVRLKVIGEISAGGPFDGRVEEGEAVRIMTGGLLPEGADSVIEVESTSETDGVVAVTRSISPGAAVRPVGEDIRKDAVVIKRGKRVRAGDIGVLASIGINNVPVAVKPKVAILSTGNELVEAHRTPERGRLRNSSGPALYAACVAAGAEPIDFGIVGDDRDDLEEALEQGLRFDILVTTGGVSAGAYDFVQHVLPEMGVDVKFHKVLIKPGKPILFGTFEDGGRTSLVFALPGNPVSSLVTFHWFVVPAIRMMLGMPPEPYRIRATLTEALRKHDDKRHGRRGILHRSDDGTLAVRTTGTQSSGAMSSMSRGNCLIILDEATGDLSPGDQVEVELFEPID